MVKEIKKEVEESATPPIEAKSKLKSKKMLLIIIGSILILGIAGGAGWYFTKGDKHAEKSEKKISKSSSVEPKFVPLDPFTVNLQREAADQFLQIGITLKILQPELEEKIKKNLPEIRSRLLVLLSSKLPSELTNSNGKKKLANEIISETEIVLGLRTAPTIPNSNIHASAKTGATSSVEAASSAKTGAASSVEAASQVEANSSEDTSVAEEGTSTKPNSEGDASIIEVLFTSFIIQ
ncbi:MAG: flagellar basal body-associated FliL family protein [Proteobacteria bacterium]|nr:flagellar basal body-associated FliL family protein [Pseudomonadota bacterium]